MNLASISIRRPVFVTCLFVLILALGILAYIRLPTTLYPDVNFPIVNVVVPFPGAAPEEIENQISKPLEDALSGITGIRALRSTSLEGAGIVTAVFTLNSDVRFSEQAVVQALARVRGDFPSGILEPSVRTIDPSDVPLMTLALTAALPEGELFELATRELLPRLKQLPQIGHVELQGGRRREIQVEVDRDRLASLEMSMGEVLGRVSASGMNIPTGQIADPKSDTLIRTIGQFNSLAAIRRIAIRFVGNETVTSLDEVASVSDGLTEEKSRVYAGGRRAIALKIYKQTGGDTLTVAQSLRMEIERIKLDFKPKFNGFDLAIVHDGTKPILAGVRDAKISIEIGILLTVLVVFFFLGSFRSTAITGIALPNSIFGAFLLMGIAGFSINITTLAALSLAVGLLIDDAIVVRESIFRRIEAGDDPVEAAVQGTNDVTLAVVATTLTVLSVFGPIAFIHGVIGQFFREFGLTISFAMLISLLDSLTMAPMLSARFAGAPHVSNWIIKKFARFQNALERVYMRVLQATLPRPFFVLGIASLIFALSFAAFSRVPKSFIPPGGMGEFQVALDTPAGTSLEAMDQVTRAIDTRIQRYPEVEHTVATIGGEHGERNKAQILVQLKDEKSRDHSTDEVKERVRQLLQSLKAHGTAQDILDIGGGAGQPFVLHVNGNDLDVINQVVNELMGQLRSGGDLKDVDSSYRAGASEFKITIDPRRAEEYGISSLEVGQELRLFLTGATSARLHSGGEQYDIRVRLKESQRDLRREFNRILVPNLNHRLIPLSHVARPVNSLSPSSIQREDRKRYIEVSADVDPTGRGLAHAVQMTRALFSSGKIRLPPGVTYEFAGQTRDFQDLLSSALLAVVLSVVFMYLVLASLYESFFVPFTILLVLPLAVCGAFYALYLTGAPLEINSMIGCILLLGVAAKNSILLVDHIHEARVHGKDLRQAILDAGRVRLRPIMMTSFALIAGMLPMAIAFNESSRQRSGMAIAVIGGLITSTLLTLVVVPAAYGYIERFEASALRLFKRSKSQVVPHA